MELFRSAQPIRPRHIPVVRRYATLPAPKLDLTMPRPKVPGSAVPVLAGGAALFALAGMIQWTSSEPAVETPGVRPRPHASGAPPSGAPHPGGGGGGGGWGGGGGGGGSGDVGPVVVEKRAVTISFKRQMKR